METTDPKENPNGLQSAWSVPVSIVLPNHRALSLVRLMRLEQQVTHIPGVGNPAVSVSPEGHVTVSVAPAAEGRVRNFLTLIGELADTR